MRGQYGRVRQRPASTPESIIAAVIALPTAHGRDALTKAADLSPSVILMDLWMPVLDGTAAIQQLKQNPATAHIPVIALTAQPYASARARALEAGAEMVLVK